MTMQTALLVHSGGFTSRQWRKLGEALSPDYRVLAPDLLGYGESEPWPVGKPFHFRQDVEFLVARIEDAGPAHLIGHSYGGFLVLQLALARPDLVRSIAVFDPVAFGILGEVDDADARAELSKVRQQWVADDRGVDEEWLAAFVDWWNGAGAWTRLPEPTREAFRSMGWKVFQEVVSLAADRTDRATYATIAAPALILGGGDSPETERRVVRRLGEALPRGTSRFFENAGHMGPISHAPLVNAAIVEHVRANSG